MGTEPPLSDDALCQPGGRESLQRPCSALPVSQGTRPMIAIQKKKAPSFPRAKIARIIEGILPKGKGYELRASDSGIRAMKIVRIVTPAWKNLRPPERISKVLAAMNGKLSDAEQQRILRFSVLTPEEYQAVVAPASAKEALDRSSL